MRGRHRGKDTRTWRDRRRREYRAWDPLIQPLADAFVKWKSGPPSPPSEDHLPSAELDAEPDPQHDERAQREASPTGDLSPDSDNSAERHDLGEPVEYSLAVYELFGMKSTLTIHRPPSSTSVAVDLAEHGFLAKTPTLPNAAIGFKTLELFHRLRLRKASFSVEAFTRVLCDYYLVGIFVFVIFNSMLTFTVDPISTLFTYNFGRCV